MIKKVLTKEGMVIYDSLNKITIELNKEETEKVLGKKVDFDSLDYHPRVVHMEISDTCDFGCKYCYNKEMNRIKGLSTEQWKKVIDTIADFNVLSCTYGGGEPFENKDIIELAKYVKSKEMTVAVTTNGKYLKGFSLEDLRTFDQINISYHEDNQLFQQALEYLTSGKIRIGINYMLSKPMLKHLKYVFNTAKKYDAELLLLAYKPMLRDYENQIPPAHVLKIGKFLATKWHKVSVDGMGGLKCVASQYFVDVNSQGKVYQCSFVRAVLGDLTKQSLKEVWENRKRVIKCPYVKEEERNSLYQHINHNPQESVIKIKV